LPQFSTTIYALLNSLISFWSPVSSSFISKIEDRLGVHQQPPKEQLAVVIYRIRTQRNKIESMSLMLQRRDKEFF
jgi:division protein CdvB (Snf7/Vps24/ESCRT-III family)